MHLFLDFSEPGGLKVMDLLIRVGRVVRYKSYGMQFKLFSTLQMIV